VPPSASMRSLSPTSPDPRWGFGSADSIVADRQPHDDVGGVELEGDQGCAGVLGPAAPALRCAARRGRTRATVTDPKRRADLGVGTAEGPTTPQHHVLRADGQIPIRFGKR
jgi:hypothetical protein